MLGKIKDARDVYTHSSTLMKDELDIIKMANISAMYKCFYRINVLAKLGLSTDKIRERFWYDRVFEWDLQSYFNIKLELMSSTEENNFDSQMRFFS